MKFSIFIFGETPDSRNWGFFFLPNNGVVQLDRMASIKFITCHILRTINFLLLILSRKGLNSTRENFVPLIP